MSRALSPTVPVVRRRADSARIDVLALPPPLTVTLAVSASSVTVGTPLVRTPYVSGGSGRPFSYSWTGLSPGVAGLDQATLVRLPSTPGSFAYR
jgi:hypothetical protein